MIDALPLEKEQTVEPSKRASIVVVDDDRDQCSVLATRLNQLGFAVRTAHRGKQGLQMVREHRPDLVLLDVRLPDMDGFDICARLADESETATIPVIIVSGMERPNAVRDARRAGSRYYVRKPYDPNALLLLIEDALADS